MKTQTMIRKLALATALVSGMLCSSAFAESAAEHKFDRKVVRTCAQANNIPLPANANVKLSQSELSTIHTCVKDFRENLEACASNLGIITAKHKVKQGHVRAYRKCESDTMAAI